MYHLKNTTLDDHSTKIVEKDDEKICSEHCGSNTIPSASKNVNAASCECQCKPNYKGNPYLGCRPNCVLNSDCPVHQACLSNECKDPCPGVCGHNSICTITNQRPSCHCKEGHSGNPFEGCSPIISITTTTPSSTNTTPYTTFTTSITTATIPSTSNNHCKKLIILGL